MVSRKRKQYTMPAKRRKTNKTKKTKKKKKCTCPPKPVQAVFGQRDVRELIFGEKRRALRRAAHRRFNPLNQYVYDVDAGTAAHPIEL